MDSAGVGYVIDGSVDDKDVISLILYWADKGYLKMKEKGKEDMEFIKLKDIPESEPRYQQTMFKELFKKKDQVNASSLQYKFADTVAIVKDDIKYDDVQSRWNLKSYPSIDGMDFILYRNVPCMSQCR